MNNYQLAPMQALAVNYIPMPLDIVEPLPQMQPQGLSNEQGSVVDSINPAITGTASLN